MSDDALDDYGFPISSMERLRRPPGSRVIGAIGATKADAADGYRNIGDEAALLIEKRRSAAVLPDEVVLRNGG